MLQTPTPCPIIMQLTPAVQQQREKWPAVAIRQLLTILQAFIYLFIIRLSAQLCRGGGKKGNLLTHFLVSLPKGQNSYCLRTPPLLNWKGEQHFNRSKCSKKAMSSQEAVPRCPALPNALGSASTWPNSSAAPPANAGLHQSEHSRKMLPQNRCHL